MFEEAAIDDSHSLQIILRCKPTPEDSPDPGLHVDEQVRTIYLKVPNSHD